MELIPAILTNDLVFLRNQIEIFSFAPIIHIDINDGTLYNGKTLPIDNILLELKTSKVFDLHIMSKYSHNIIATIIKSNKLHAIRYIFSHNSEDLLLHNKVKFALDPNTYKRQFKTDVILLMTVLPGKQGSPFIKENLDIINKIKYKSLFLDGGITKNTVFNNIFPIKNNIKGLCIGSYFQEEPIDKYHELKSFFKE